MIGQRKDFSRNDVAKINRMYQCSEPLINHFFCEFTEENIGGFVNQPIDDKDLAKEENVSQKFHISGCHQLGCSHLKKDQGANEYWLF